MSAPLTDGINLLTSQANAATGASDTTLSDAIKTLIAGYGQGSGNIKIESGVLTINESTDDIVINHNLEYIPDFAYVCADVSEGSLIPLGACFFATYGFINVMNLQGIPNTDRLRYEYYYRHATSGNILGGLSQVDSRKYSDKKFTFTRGAYSWSPTDTNGDTMHYKWMVGRFTE